MLKVVGGEARDGAGPTHTDGRQSRLGLSVLCRVSPGEQWRHDTAVVTSLESHMANTPPKPASLRLNIQTCVQRIQPKLMPVIRHLTRRISKLNCLLSDHETSQRKTVKKTRRAQGKCFFQ